jgi:hypothetical protein
LLAAVEEKDRALAAAMRAKLEILRNFMRGNENPHPYECVTHFLIHAFTMLAPPMSDNTLQLWVYIMHHPEFRIADVPTSAYKIRAFNKLFPSVEPGNVLSTAFVDAVVSESVPVSAVVTKPTRSGPTGSKEAPLQTTRTIQLTVDYISFLGKMEQWFNNPEKRSVV